jgi:hypothetical protein
MIVTGFAPVTIFPLLVLAVTLVSALEAAYCSLRQGQPSCHKSFICD